MLLQLFLSFFQVGFLSFGGGYAAIPIIQDLIINTNKWLTNEDFNNILAIAQITPGPIGINVATFSGLKVGGIIGALTASISFVIPSFILSSIFGWLYFKYRHLDSIKEVLSEVRPVIAAIILSAGIIILKNTLAFNFNTDITQLAFFIISLFIAFRFKMNPILLMLLVGFLSWLTYIII